MKKTLHLLIPLLGGALALPLVCAAHPDDLRVLADGHDMPSDGDGHMYVHHIGSHEMESVAFLGVETSPVPSVLTAQLGLPKESGLVVRHVVTGSPAASVLEVHDVLLKLDDQLLIEPRQFSVLVRSHKEGEEVTLTYVRAGKQATAKVKLAKHDVPKLARAEPGAPGGENVFKFRMQHDGPGAAPEEMDRVLALLDREHHGLDRDVVIQHDPGMRELTVHPGNSNMVFTDEAGSLELTIKDGKKTLVAKNAKGEPLFSGPVDTPAQRQALVPEIRGRLDKLEGMDGFSFEGDPNFHGNVKYERAATKIVLPRSEPDLDGLPPSPVY